MRNLLSNSISPAIAAVLSLCALTPSAHGDGVVAIAADGSVGYTVNRGEACGDIFWNADYTWEQGIAWSQVYDPFYGAFVECYEGVGEVCAIRLALATGHNRPYLGSPAEGIVWNDEGGVPGSVRCLHPGWVFDDISAWPEVSIERIPMSGCCVEGPFWVGFRGLWIGGTPEDFYIGIDRAPSTVGCALTNIPVGIGYPNEGWQHISEVGFSGNALGIGAELRQCLPTPTQSSTWGRVKSLYRA